MAVPEEIIIRSGAYAAAVSAAGGGLRSLTHEGVDVIGGYAPGAVVSGGRGQVLVPWPNRMRDGRYRFDQVDYQVPISEPDTGNASHGLVRWCTWTLTRDSDAAATARYRMAGQSGYPWTLDLTAHYHLDGAGVRIDLTATNRSAHPAPLAVGMHPYLDAGVSLDHTTLQLAAGTHQLLDERKLPSAVEATPAALDFSEARSLAGVRLDDAFTDLARDDRGLAWVTLAGARVVRLWLGETWSWIQVYSGDDLPAKARSSLAVEPMTAPPDAFNSGTDLVVLDPEATWSGSFGIELAS